MAVGKLEYGSTQLAASRNNAQLPAALSSVAVQTQGAGCRWSGLISAVWLALGSSDGPSRQRLNIRLPSRRYYTRLDSIDAAAQAAYEQRNLRKRYATSLTGRRSSRRYGVLLLQYTVASNTAGQNYCIYHQ